jgi:carbohydrate kinase (thermoresistant glucokinase family)
MFNGAAVVMGVASCGKTTLGELLAAYFKVPFVEGDNLHSPESVAKMSAGIPLTDDDRWPWLGRVGDALAGETACIASCSSLKRSYRDAIRSHAKRDVAFVHLHGTRELLAARIAGRKGHFMPASLLDSQLKTLEMPGADEHSVTIDIAWQPEEQLHRSIAFLQQGNA